MIAVAAAVMMMASQPAPALAPEDAAATLKVAGAGITRALGRPATLEVERQASSGDWVFLRGRMTERSAAQLSYAGTPFAQAARDGFKSDAFAALLRRHGPGWTLIDLAVGPTDVAWATWGHEHGAPPELFGD